MTKNFESIEAIEKDFSRRTLQSTFIDSEEAEVFDDKLSANKYEKLEEKTPNKKRRIGEDVPWKEEELLMLYKTEKWGKMHGNLPLAREIFLPRRSESDIKEKKQSEEYKEFRQTLKEFHTIDQNKKRKIDDNDERQKESEVQKKSTPSSKDESRKNSPKQKKIQKMVPSNVKKGKK